MTNTSSIQATLAEPRFKIGQDVHLRTGGPEMVVNQCTQGLDGKFVIDTIWFEVDRRTEARATYQEELLDARDIPLNKKSPTGVTRPDSSVSSPLPVEVMSRNLR
jgi:uncharacterized protein YodC (DUF2158 family)